MTSINTIESFYKQTTKHKTRTNYMKIILANKLTEQYYANNCILLNSHPAT